MRNPIKGGRHTERACYFASHRLFLQSLLLVAILAGGNTASRADGPDKSMPRKAAIDAKLGAAPADGSAPRALELKFGEQPAEQLNLQIGGRPTIARDDGREGDRQARDGVFTTQVDRDQAQRFEKFAAAKRTNAKPFEGRMLREAIATDADCEPTPLPPTGLTPEEEKRFIDQSLMIIDTSVVDSAEAHSGSWSFGHLMTELASHATTGIAPEVFTEKWLGLWLEDQRVNPHSPGAEPIRKRENLQALILNPWREASGGGKLDLGKAPFRLLAIVLRLDLRNNLVIGPAPRIGGGGAGELRFVYGVTDRQQQQQPFTIIFEYEVQRENFAGVLAWAEQVYALYRDYDRIDRPEYRSALQRLTTAITSRGANPQQVPNGSLLAQIRTNENALNRVWELREFRLDSGNTGYLSAVTVKQTPELKINGQMRLADFLDQQESALRCEQHVVPIEYQGEAFVAGSALNPPEDTTPTEATLIWKVEGLEARLLEARHRLSIATCNGCHGGETKTSTFLHIAPRDVGERSVLSGFLTGIVVSDPAGQMEHGQVKSREFHDLARRARDLKALVEYQEAYEIQRPVLQMVH